MQKNSTDILFLLLLSAFAALAINFINLSLIKKDNPQNLPVNNQHTLEGVTVGSVDNECESRVEN